MKYFLGDGKEPSLMIEGAYQVEATFLYLDFERDERTDGFFVLRREKTQKIWLVDIELMAEFVDKYGDIVISKNNSALGYLEYPYSIRKYREDDLD